MQQLFPSEPLYFCNDDLIYIADFYDGQRAALLCAKLQQELEWQQEQIMMFAKPVLIPRLQAWYGDRSALYQYSGLALTPLPWTATLACIKKDIEHSYPYRFNSVLANLYRDQQDGMGWHSDNEAELGSNPVIASLSLGQERKFAIKHKSSGEKLNLNLQSGSLLIMRGQLQQHWRHSLPKSKKFMAARINLTFRNIIGTTNVDCR